MFIVGDFEHHITVIFGSQINRKSLVQKIIQNNCSNCSVRFITRVIIKSQKVTNIPSASICRIIVLVLDLINNNNNCNLYPP